MKIYLGSRYAEGVAREVKDLAALALWVAGWMLPIIVVAALVGPRI